MFCKSIQFSQKLSYNHHILNFYVYRLGMIMNELLKPDQRKHFPITKCLRKILADKVNEYKSTHQYSHIINNYPVTIFSKKQCRFLNKNAFTSQSVFFEKQSAHIDEVKKWVDERYDLSIHLEQNVLFQKVFQKYGTDVLIVNTKDKTIRKLQNLIANVKSDLAFRIPTEIPKTINKLNYELGLQSNPYNLYQKQTNYVILKDDFLKFINDLDNKLKFEIKVDIQFDGEKLDYPKECKISFSSTQNPNTIYNSKSYTHKVELFVQTYPELFEKELLKFVAEKQICLNQIEL